MRKDSIQHYAVVTLQHLAHPHGEPMPRSASQAPNAGKATATTGKTAPELPKTPPSRRAPRAASSTSARRRRSAPAQRSQENSDVLVSAVISTYLLTHLHHVLQRAEFGAVQEGRQSQAANYAQGAKCSAWMPAAWKMPRHPASAIPTSRVLPEGYDRTACCPKPWHSLQKPSEGNVCMSEQSAGSQQRQSKTGDSE